MDSSKMIYPSVAATYCFTAITTQHGLGEVRAFLNTFLEARATVVTAGIAAEPRWLNQPTWTKELIARSPISFELSALHPISPSQLTQAWSDYVPKDLAYNSPIMRKNQSEQLLKRFLALFNDRPFEILINRVGKGWNPTTPCTFDITILTFSPELLVILAFGDED